VIELMLSWFKWYNTTGDVHGYLDKSDPDNVLSGFIRIINDPFNNPYPSSCSIL